ncbi:MAG: hypothetical protein N4A72_19955 [Bacteroidales bacterium]|jgi:uncharacterized protein with PIN domain|nr:hypothetical protein [Bacteroidales bacterium]
MRLYIPNSRETDIPEQFKTFVSEEHFCNCIKCGKELIESDSEYFIEKVFRKGEIEFEYAICSDCAEKVNMELSTESKENIEKYMSERVENLSRNIELLSNPDAEYDEWLVKCMITGSNIDKDSDYQIAAQFKGDKMILSFMPYAVSIEAIEEMQELLSAKTKDELDNFKKQNLDLPPEFLEFIKTSPFVFV